LDAFLERKKLTPEVENYIRQAAAEKSRHGSGFVSNCSDVPCPEFGSAIATESSGWEYPALMTARYDPHVLRVFEQPPKVTTSVVVPDRHGRNKTVQLTTTPDFLVIFDDDRIEIWETKPAQKLATKCVEHPVRYQAAPDGQRYHSAPFEKHFSSWASYLILTEANLDRRFVTAARFLAPYRAGAPRVAVTDEECRAFVVACEATPGIRVGEIDSIEPARRAEVLLYLVARCVVFAELDEVITVCPDDVRIFPTAVDQEAFRLFRAGSRKPVRMEDTGYILKPGDLIEFNHREYSVVSKSATSVSLKNEDGETNKFPIQVLVDGKALLADSYHLQKTFEHIWGHLLSIEDRAAYHHRKCVVSAYLPGGKFAGARPRSRTERRWLAAFNATGDLGLLPAHYRSGRRESHLDSDVEQALKHLIERSYLRPGAKTARWLLGELTNLKAERKIIGKLPALRTVYRHIAKRDRFLRVRKMKGHKVAMQLAHIQQPGPAAPSVHGESVFQVAHMDSTPEDAQTVDGPKGWVAALIDSYSSKILATHRSATRPTGETIRALLLNCFEQHETLPAIVRYDYGSEHRTNWMRASLLRIGVTLSPRQKGKPTGGSHVESAFSTALRCFYQNLNGSTTSVRNPRQRTKAVDPKRLTTWTNDDLEEKLAEFVALHNSSPKGQRPSPDSIELACRQKFGPPPILGESLKALETLLLPYANGRVRRVSARGTIRVGGKNYFSDRLYCFAGKPVQVRVVGPEIVYALPPGRAASIECKLLTYGRPNQAILDAAHNLDADNWAESHVPGVTNAELKHSEFVAGVEKLQAEKRAKPRKARPPQLQVLPAEQPAPAAPAGSFSFAKLPVSSTK
jgi:putative transposase